MILYNKQYIVICKRYTLLYSCHFCTFFIILYILVIVVQFVVHSGSFEPCTFFKNLVHFLYILGKIGEQSRWTDMMIVNMAVWGGSLSHLFFFKSDMMVVNMAVGVLLLPLGSMDWLIICPWVIKSKLKSFVFIKKQSYLFLISRDLLYYHSLRDKYDY